MTRMPNPLTMFSIRDIMVFLEHQVESLALSDKTQQTCLEQVLIHVQEEIERIVCLQVFSNSALEYIQPRFLFLKQIEAILINSSINKSERLPFIHFGSWPWPWKWVWQGAHLSHRIIHQIEFWHHLYDKSLEDLATSDDFDSSVLLNVLVVLKFNRDDCRSWSYVNWLLMTGKINPDDLILNPDFRAWFDDRMFLQGLEHQQVIELLRSSFMHPIWMVWMNESSGLQAVISSEPSLIAQTTHCWQLSQEQANIFFEFLIRYFGVDGLCLAFRRMELEDSGLLSKFKNMLQCMDASSIPSFQRFFLFIMGQSDEQLWMKFYSCFHSSALKLIGLGWVDALIFLLDQPQILLALPEKTFKYFFNQFLSQNQEYSISMLGYQKISRVLHLICSRSDGVKEFRVEEKKLIERWWLDAHRLLEGFSFSDLTAPNPSSELAECVDLIKYFSACPRKNNYLLEAIQHEVKQFRTQLELCLGASSLALDALHTREQLRQKHAKFHALLSLFFPLKRDAYPVTEEAWLAELTMALANVHPVESIPFKNKWKQLKLLNPLIYTSQEINLSVLLLTYNKDLRQYIFKKLIDSFPKNYFYLERGKMSLIAYALSMPNHEVLALMAEHMLKEKTVELTSLIDYLQLLDARGFCLGHLLIDNFSFFMAVVSLASNQELERILLSKNQKQRTLLHEVVKNTDVLGAVLSLIRQRSLQAQFQEWMSLKDSNGISPWHVVLHHQTSLYTLMGYGLTPMNSEFKLSDATQPCYHLLSSLATETGFKNFLHFNGEASLLAYLEQASEVSLRSVVFSALSEVKNLTWIGSHLPVSLKRLWISPAVQQDFDLLALAYHHEPSFMYLIHHFFQDLSDLRKALAQSMIHHRSLIIHWAMDRAESFNSWLRSLSVAECIYFINFESHQADEHFLLMQQLASFVEFRETLFDLLWHDDQASDELQMWNLALYDFYRRCEQLYLNGEWHDVLSLDQVFMFCLELCLAGHKYMQSSTQEAYEHFSHVYQTKIDEMVDFFKIPILQQRLLHHGECQQGSEVDESTGQYRSARFQFFVAPSINDSMHNLPWVLERLNPSRMSMNSTAALHR